MNDGRRSLITLCEMIPDYLQQKKREQIPTELIANKFNIDEHWVIKNEHRFEFTRNEALDFCNQLVVDMLRKAAPEKSKSLYFWIGFGAGFLFVIALSIGGTLNFLDLWLR